MQWNIEAIYPSLQSSEFAGDIKYCEALVEELKTLSLDSIPDIAEAFQKMDGLDSVFYNLQFYTHAILTIDIKNAEAKNMDSCLQNLSVTIANAKNPFFLRMKTCEDSFFNECSTHPGLQNFVFVLTQLRANKDIALSLPEEDLIGTLTASGHQAWGDLYYDIVGGLKVVAEIDGNPQTLGLAKASSFLRVADPANRKSVWLGIQSAWDTQKTPVAAILNSLAQWRLDLYRKRSHTKPVHFLDVPCFENRIQRKTLEAMMDAIVQSKSKVQETGFKMAKMLGKEKLAPWDLLAPAPFKSSSQLLSFDDGNQFLQEAFKTLSDDFSDFAKMMYDGKWIEGRVLDTKSTGAYCGYFTKDKQPYVFMTYMGSQSDISTLAHELGHAYHSWIMRDLPLCQTHYPSTLAETASIFAERTVLEYQLKKATTAEEKNTLLWNNYSDALSLLANIPARFSFEKSFYEARLKGPVPPERLSELMDQAWSQFYGQTLSQNEKLFWATKLHFSIAGSSFYNFPYTFGYLFSLSLFARKESFGKTFSDKYKQILMDTGRMTAEDLIQKHLGEDITRPDFWTAAIATAIPNLL